jgi:hypothetical protein
LVVLQALSFKRAEAEDLSDKLLGLLAAQSSLSSQLEGTMEALARAKVCHDGCDRSSLLERGAAGWTNLTLLIELLIANAERLGCGDDQRKQLQKVCLALGWLCCCECSNGRGFRFFVATIFFQPMLEFGEGAARGEQ